MKATLWLGIVCTALSLSAPALAQRHRDGIRTQAYEYGWDAANDFCQDLRPRRFRAHMAGRSITRTFSRYCKRGFDDLIDNNRACKRRIRREGAWSEMWDARRDACQ